MNNMKAKLIKTVTDNYILADTTKEFHGEGYLLGTTTVSDAPKLSKQNCDEIFGVVDVEELSMKNDKGIYRSVDGVISYRQGFNKAVELNKDKLFTLEDMMNCWNKALKFQEHKETLGDFIQSLQQPTEIDVEIEMECPRCQEWGYVSECRKDCNKKFLQPKLDSEGCLILKKI